eukprot:Lithocolla_globosa_v1_NODE_3008_length_1796_cov_3.538771.p3 type:complete len:108 gc:universal NODE_3008_length_1796_cov_3.538771:888-565(-)
MIFFYLQRILSRDNILISMKVLAAFVCFCFYLFAHYNEHLSGLFLSFPLFHAFIKSSPFFLLSFDALKMQPTVNGRALLLCSFGDFILVWEDLFLFGTLAFCAGSFF